MRGSWREPIVMLVSAMLLGSCAWAQFRGNAEHTGAGADTTISATAVGGLVPAWNTTTGGAVRSSPAISGGTVYVGSDDKRLYALGANGAVQWSVVTGGPVRSSPAVDGGLVVVGSDDHRLYARNTSDGTSAWTVPVDSQFAGVTSAPTLSGGTVYAASASTVYAFAETTGVLAWSHAVTSSVPLSAPAVANGVVYVASYADATVFAFDASTGATVWTYTAPGTRGSCPTAASSPAVAGNALYVALCPSTAAPTKSLFALDAGTGATMWSSGAAVDTTSPAVANDVVYVASADGTLDARDASNGTARWTAALGAAVSSSPVVVNGVLYLGADDGALYAFDANGQRHCTGTPVTCQPLWSETTSGPVRSSPAVVNGVVYVGSDDHRLYAFGMPPVAFDKSVLAGTASSLPTVSRFGPDGRLYVAQFDGSILAYTIARAGPNNYQVTATERITAIDAIPNHDDDGTVNSSVTTRLITGLLVTGTPANPVLYVASSDPRTGGGPDNVQTNLDTNSGVISRLTVQGGAWHRLDLVSGLPRSEENHATNALALDPATNTLYVGQGGNTNEGAPSNNFGFLPEYAYSGAILSIDLTAIGNTSYALPTLVDEDHPSLTGPFGGDRGKHQAKITAASPVQVYAPGFRNPFALVRTAAGRLYAVDNGPNAGWGDVPIGAGPQGTCTNAVNEPGVHDGDSLHYISHAGYYGGHANPTRGNRSNTFNTTNPQSPVPAANPVECDARFSNNNASIATLPAATAGMAEYTSAALADQLDGRLLVADQGLGTVTAVTLGANGATASTNTLFTNVGLRPIDVAVQGDTDAFPGTIFVPDFADGSIYVFEPVDFGGRLPPPCTGADDPALDEDHDGYSNADEIDNGTDPCSAGDTPHDWNHNGVSDLNDPDDDSDGIPDVSDPFPVDPSNGLTTSVPVTYSWQNGTTDQPCAPTPFASGCPGGLLGLGFTGLMTNGTTNYASQFDPSNLIAGGAAGVLTIATTPPGDASGATNTQAYAFQYGVNAHPTATGPFTVRARVNAPFAGVTPTGGQSMGMYIGNGDQDNFAKLVLTANNGTPGVAFVREVAGTTTATASTGLALPGPDFVDLLLTVDPAAATVSAAYQATTNGTAGAVVTVIGPTAIPTAWVTSTTRGLAVGLIATSAGGPPISVTWSLLTVGSG